jgi:hypothetical protein
LKLKLIKYTKDINTCVATREYNISVANEQWWRKDKEQLQSASSIRKMFCVVLKLQSIPLYQIIYLC